MSMKVVINEQTPEVYETTAGVHQNSIFGPILFLIYINVLPKSLILINIYAVYGCTYKNLDNKNS